MRVSASHAGRSHHSRVFCFGVEAFVRRASRSALAGAVQRRSSSSAAHSFATVPSSSWRAKGADSSTQLPIAWSMMPSETKSGEGEARRARIGTFRSSQGPLYREDCENTPLVNYHRLTSVSSASFAACAAIGARNCRDLVASTAANMHGSTLTGGWCYTTR